MAEGLSLVVIIMSRGLVYENILRNSWKNSEKHSIELFEKFLVEMYKHTLLFLIAASKHYTGGFKGSMKRLWTSTWDPKLILDFRQNTTRIQHDLQDEEASIFRIGVQGGLSSLLESNEALQSRLTDLEALDASVKLDLSSLLQGQEEIRSIQQQEANHHQKKRERYERKNHSKVLRWLSEFPYIDHHMSAKGDRVPDTGDWIFQRDEYKDWYQSQERRILWIHGIRKS